MSAPLLAHLFSFLFVFPMASVAGLISCRPTQHSTGIPGTRNMFEFINFSFLSSSSSSSRRSFTFHHRVPGPSASWNITNNNNCALIFVVFHFASLLSGSFSSVLWQANLLMVRKISKLNEKMIKAI
jgi:hypothetical protein